MKIKDKILWSYIAGFFDGEGCVYFGFCPQKQRGYRGSLYTPNYFRKNLGYKTKDE